MESKAKMFGHAIHPILIVFPLGLLATSVIFDVIYLLTSSPTWHIVSFWMIAAGIVGGLMAAVFGLIDFLYIPSGTRAKSIGAIHGIVNVIVVGLFGASLWLRHSSDDIPSTGALVLSFAGFVLALVGGWFGGELVERLGVSVSPGANLNAPSSLTSKPVTKTPAPPTPLRRAS